MRIPSTGSRYGQHPISKSKLGHRNRIFQHLLQRRWSHPATPLQGFGPSPRPFNLTIQRLPVFPLSPSRPRHNEFHLSSGRCAASTIQLCSQPHVLLPLSPLFRRRPQVSYRSDLWSSVTHALGVNEVGIISTTSDMAARTN